MNGWAVYDCTTKKLKYDSLVSRYGIGAGVTDEWIGTGFTSIETNKYSRVPSTLCTFAQGTAGYMDHWRNYMNQSMYAMMGAHSLPSFEGCSDFVFPIAMTKDGLSAIDKTWFYTYDEPGGPAAFNVSANRCWVATDAAPLIKTGMNEQREWLE